METTTLIAWTLLHFLWQGALIAVAFAIVGLGLRRASASARYLAGVVALSAMALVPAATAIRLSAGGGAPAIDEGPALAAVTAPARTSQAPQAVATTLPRVAESVFRPDPSPAETPNFPRLRAWGDALAPYIVRLWLAGVLLLSLRLVAGWVGVRRLVREAVREPGEHLKERFSEIAARLGNSGAARLVESAIVSTPAVVGFFRPVVLWPISLSSGLTVAQIDVLLAHELAHLKRNDYVVNLLQTVLETALFYHPAVWWISGRVREEREACCDDIAADLTGDRREFAEALMALETWRRSAPMLAPAASGGNLLHRIERLVRPESSRPADGARWTALPLAGAALIGILAADRSAAARPGEAQVASETVEIKMHGARIGKGDARVSGNPRPSKVERYDGAGALAARLKWATAKAEADGDTRYWIGYAIASRPNAPLFYTDRFVPVTTQDGSVFMGRARFRQADRLSFKGVGLEEVIGSVGDSDSVVLLGFRSGRPGVVDRIHASSAGLPAHFEGHPLYWLNRATDAESLSFLQDLIAKASTDEDREDLVSVIGMHADSRIVFEIVRSLVGSSGSRSVRESAVEEAGELDLPEAVSFLERVARDDRDPRLRVEAAEALGEQPSADATRALGALVRDLRRGDVAREAAESLGERADPAAFDELVKIVWSDAAQDVREEAVEAMGEARSPRGSEELRKIVRIHVDEDIRREALETLGELEDPEGEIEFFEKIVIEDQPEPVREEAVEALASIETERSRQALARIARADVQRDVRRKSIESLWEKGARVEALGALDTMVASSDGRTARAGLEMLGDLEAADAVKKLATIAKSDSRSDVQRAAVEALGNAMPAADAFAALSDIVANHPLERVQHQAVESMGRLELPGVLKELERIARSHGSEQVRVAAVEAMDEEQGPEVVAALEGLAQETPRESVQIAAIEALANDGGSKERLAWLARQVENGSSPRVRMAALDALEEAGPIAIDALVQIVRTAKDREARQRALEILAESPDPRARKELARILEK